MTVTIPYKHRVSEGRGAAGNLPSPPLDSNWLEGFGSVDFLSPRLPSAAHCSRDPLWFRLTSGSESPGLRHMRGGLTNAYITRLGEVSCSFLLHHPY
ncbi:hypothetical protein E2C01_064825 [Portunus trituberculatus]|uniref:Uncharacterized protein n=1 Tax=Portunus trituberculatus TaxID=210409 RepID=A0A5B7HK71_PORTR|nr:hypothetical protein [Portunus trituberculatus]